LVLEAGAEDMKTSDEDVYEIITAPADFEKVKTALTSKQIPLASAEVTQVPQTLVPLKGADAESMLALMQELEDHEDVKTVHANFDVPKEILNKVLSA
jgi:transcriptional/translational regulatory protein YebC/TACO1